MHRFGSGDMPFSAWGVFYLSNDYIREIVYLLRKKKIGKFFFSNQGKDTKKARLGSITFDVGMTQRLRKCQ